MSKPTPKQNFLQAAMFAAVIFLGFQILFGPKNEQKDTRTLDQIHQSMVVENQKLQDLSILATNEEYSKKLDDQVAKKVISPADAETRRVAAIILVADTQFKEGLYRDDTGRIRAAYASVQPFQQRMLDKPAWNTSYSIAAPLIPGPFLGEDKSPLKTSVTNFSWKSWTGQDLYAAIVKDLTARNRTEYVYGFLPGYGLMDFLVHLTGAMPGFSYAFAGFLLALLVRSIVYPLAQKQLMFGRQMSQLVPLTNEIKAKYKNDQATQQQKVMELYREYGINPLAGCFPALIQMPLFLTVYQCMLKYQFAFQKGVFLWINPSTSKSSNGFIAPNLGQQDYILIAIYGITMLSATLLTPVSDPSQAKQQRLMGAAVAVIFTVFMFTGKFPVVSGFVLYWTFTNILATAQSLRAYRMPLPPLVKVHAAGGGVLPKPASRWQQMMDKMMAEQNRLNTEKASTDGSGNKTDHSSSKNGSSQPIQSISQEAKKTGTPAKHKPKKRK